MARRAAAGLLQRFDSEAIGGLDPDLFGSVFPARTLPQVFLHVHFTPERLDTSRAFQGEAEQKLDDEILVLGTAMTTILPARSVQLENFVGTTAAGRFAIRHTGLLDP